ncbi:MAG TPA: serine hydrolase [Gemmatimonadaceae bacterium]
MKRFRAGILLLLGFAAPVVSPLVAHAQLRDSVALERRAAQMTAFLNGASLSLDTVFDAAFLAQVTPTQMHAIAAQLAQVGRVQRTSITSEAVPSGAQFQLATDKGYAIPMSLTLDASPPNLISGLLFGQPALATGTMDDLLKELAALPGHASLYAARIDGDRLVPVATLDTGRALAIGSAFKLYALSELAHEIEQSKRHWADVVLLDSTWRSLPSGILQTWPAGTPMTLQTLATLMISQSDNTAADHMVRTLGREKVEAIQSVAGNSHATMNEPFLTTREMFALKSPTTAALLSRYIAGNTATRRAVLTDPALLAKQRVPDFSHGPIAIDAVEWFASTADLARTMLWLRDHSESGPAAAARGVLSVNKGIPWPAAAWKYAGFKGGSEPGVINLSFIAQRADGQWIVLTATWNNSAAPVDETKFVSLIVRARDLIGLR